MDFIGYVDRHRNGTVWGWACCPSSPESRLTIRVMSGTRQIGAVVADQFRRDLAAAGIGDKSGCYMFRFRIPESLRGRGAVELRFVVNDGQELTGSPLSVVELTGESYRLQRGAEAATLSETFHVLEDDGDGTTLPVNSGLAFMNAKRRRPGPKTVIVVGHARSGTSLVARALHVAGVPMWLHGPLTANYEDKEFVKVLQDAIDKPPLDEARMDGLIAERDRAYETWGFKAPTAMEELPYLLHHTRNPQVILVFRDMLATCLREHLSVDSDPWEAFESILSYQANMLTMLRNTDVPCFLVSYEKAILNPEFFCRKLGEFLERTAEPHWINEAVLQINPNQRDYLESVELVREDLGLAPLARRAKSIAV